MADARNRKRAAISSYVLRLACGFARWPASSYRPISDLPRQTAQALPVGQKFRPFRNRLDCEDEGNCPLHSVVAMLASSRSRMSKTCRRRSRNRWAWTLGIALLAMSGCLPRGPISVSWPWRHSANDGPDCNNAGDDLAVSAPYSLFHPVPTRPVFTPWVADDPPPSHRREPLPPIGRTKNHSTNGRRRRAIRN